MEIQIFFRARERLGRCEANPRGAAVEDARRTMASSSHVIEGDPSSWKTSYVENATNLFNKDVPVCVKGGADGAQEKIEELTVRILLGLNKQKQSKVRALDVLPPRCDARRNVRRVRADPEDPNLRRPPDSAGASRPGDQRDGSFLLPSHGSLRGGVSSLKVEQSILVDFAQFPDKFIELLEECIASRGEESPRFLAVLRVGADADENSSLGVVETNKFKHLSHISLAFKPGDDAAIKQYLAARLMDVKGERDDRAKSHRDTSEELRAARGELEIASGVVAAAREHAEKVEAAAQTRLDELSAKLKKSHMEELDNTKTRMEGERGAAEAACADRVSDVSQQFA